jgi:UDP-N-acetylglucosamine:LPS N-acetylglucosamine transferase
MKKLLAVASGGGHWVQLLRLRKAFEGCEVRYVTTKKEYANEVIEPLLVVTDANGWEKVRLIKMCFEVAWLVLRVRPDIVITTGAAPGLAAIFFGKIAGAKTIWLDSIANSEELSASGKFARKWADAWLTQWPHLSEEGGPAHWGSVL